MLSMIQPVLHQMAISQQCTCPKVLTHLHHQQGVGHNAQLNQCQFTSGQLLAIEEYLHV